MTPLELLNHYDSGLPWPVAPSSAAGFDVRAAYQQALAVRALRLARGEQPRGFKIGFTNRSIWARYQVFAPIWGTVYDSTLRFCDGQAALALAGTCQPRIEPEVVFGMHATPAPGATLDALFAAIDWVAPGFEIVQSHLPDWKFQAADTVADGSLHARLLVGQRQSVQSIASTAGQLEAPAGRLPGDAAEKRQPGRHGLRRQRARQPAARPAPFLGRTAAMPGCARADAGRRGHHRHLDRRLARGGGRAVAGRLWHAPARVARGLYQRLADSLA